MNDEGKEGRPVRSEVSTERLWTVREVADYLGMSQSWVYRQVEANAIPHAKLGTALRFHPERVREFARSGAVSSTNVIALHGRRG